ncbi:hypothetical protein DH2020_043648 [Rehmannia glutinosa]|uniref:Ubiquitin-like protease family profile domain-containing protein n=1 Tax=Rehmannia glutinosa TaxID=99300 RepID=A0ABR0UJ92_REHGL
MGTLNSTIRYRGDDCSKTLVSISPPIDRSYSHISKRRKVSVSKNKDTPEYSSSYSVLPRISLYPHLKPRFSREVHAPVRQSRLSSFSRIKKVEDSAGFEESSADKMGNCLGIQFPYDKVRNGAIKSLNFFRKDNDSLIGKDVVIEIDDADDNENRGVPLGDSSIEEIEIVDVDASNANENVNGVEKMTDVMLLDGNRDNLGVPVHKKLYDFSKRIDEKLNSLKLEIEYNEKCRQTFQILRSQKKEDQVKKDAVEECFVPLTEEDEALVDHALSNSNRRKVLVIHENSNIDITGEKLQCLRPGAWLNDELISGRDGYNFQAVRRWTTQRKLGYSLLDCEKIFVPIHKEIHWCLAVINKKDEKFQYLDSLKGVDSQVMNVLARYYVDEVKDKCGKDISVSSWEKEFVTNLPGQENGFDCGMFMIKYTDFYSRDVGLCFNQGHMPYFRRRTSKEILKLRAE